jgi:2,3-bisphosphoglycerate-dependent phosphoglycerate mutase
MKLFYSLFIVFTLVSCSKSLPDQTVYLVRHAEKDTSDVKATNPPLVDAGIERAARLGQLLDTVQFTEIYSTIYDRNISTIKPLLEKQNITPLIYEWKEWKSDLDEIKGSAGTFLICGHGNNLLPMIKYLGVNPPIDDIGHHDYENLFKVTRVNGKVEVSLIKF